MYADKYASKISEIPAETKYIVLYNGTFSEAGYYKDDPSTTGHKIDIACFFTKESMMQYVIEEITPKEWNIGKKLSDFVIIEYKPIAVTMTTNFDFK